MQLNSTYLLLTLGIWVCRATYYTNQESEAPATPDLRTQAEHTKFQASLGLTPATGILFLVTASVLLSLEVLQGNLFHRVSLTLLLLLPLLYRGVLNTLNDRKESHDYSIQASVAVKWKVALLCCYKE